MKERKEGKEGERRIMEEKHGEEEDRSKRKAMKRGKT